MNFNLQDVRQTKEYARFMRKMGWQVEKINKTFIYIKKLPLLPFSVIKILRGKKPIQLGELKKLIRKYRPLFFKLQPFHLRGVLSWKLDQHPLIPTKTIWLDLGKSEKQLLKEMKPKMRYNIGLVLRKGAKTKIVSGDKMTDKQLMDFYHLWRQNKPFNWLFRPNFNELKYLKESFKKKCFFVLVLKDKTLVSQVFILCSKNMAFDWFGASSPQGRKLFAKSLVIWEAIKESKKRGLKIFDFEGIYDERYPWLNRGWRGFSRFKKGFGGEEIEFDESLIKLLPGGA
jgi:lipid II:glycine glycyltransferase (peptidoglycan interpeptide bridge formation enzyme)